MRLKEQRLWDRMRKNAAPFVRLERIENSASDGICDVMALAFGKVTFIELKCADSIPVRPTTRLLGAEGLSVVQRNWHLDWAKHGGRSLIVVGVNDLPHHWAVRGHFFDQVNDMTIAQLTQHSVAYTLRRGTNGDFWRQLWTFCS